MKSLLIGKDPDAGKDWRQRRGWQRMKWLDSITNSMDMNLSNLREIVKDKGAWGAAVYGTAKRQTRLSDWTTTATHTVNWTFVSFSKLQRFQEYLYYFPNCSYILTSSVINSSFIWRICELSSLALDFFHMLWNVILQAQLEGVFFPSTSLNPFLCLLTLSWFASTEPSGISRLEPGPRG